MGDTIHPPVVKVVFMLNQRLMQNLSWQMQAHGEQVFGQVKLLPPPSNPSPLAPIKRVAILTEAFLPKVDGVTKTAYLTVRYLQETGREVLVFAPDIAPETIGPTEIISLPSVGIPLAPETRMALPNPVVARHLDAFKPDLIHLFSPALMAVNGMAMGRHMNIPVIANYQTDLPGYARAYGISILSWPMTRWLRYIHNGCHLTLVPTESTRQELQQEGYHRLRQWGRGVNIDRFNPQHRSATMRQRLLNGRPDSSLLCIYVGRLANEKRVDLLVDVARLPGVALTIIGDGQQRENLEQVFNGTDTHFTGYLFGDELARAFASADVFLFTGPNETFGQVVQEAMASGLPPVVIDQGGVRDLVNELDCGFTCPPQPAAFAQVVTQLRDNPHLRWHMARKARRFTRTRPWWRIMQQLETHYHEAIQLNNRFRQIFGATTYHLPLPVPQRFHKGR